jgi:MFS family permease
MEQRLLERNIKLYQTYQAFLEPIFWGPILIMFLNNAAKMTLSQIDFMEGIVVCSLVIMQIPTGALADLIGRKKTMFIGSLLFVVENLLFASATSPLLAWTANFIWAIGFSLISGADSALICDTLCALGRKKEYRKIQGDALFYRYAIAAVSCLVTGYLAKINLRLPVYLSVFGLVLNCFVIARLVEPPMAGEKRRFCLREFIALHRISLIEVWKNPRIKWLIAFSAILGISSKLWFFTYNPFFEIVKLPLVSYGFIFCALNSVAALSSRFSDKIYEKLGDSWSIILTILLSGLPMILMGIYPVMFCAWLVILQNFARGYMRPFTEHMMHDCLESKNRATIMSIQASITSLGQAVGLFLTGLYLAKFSLLSFLIYLGALTLISGLVMASRFRRTFG